MAIRNASVARLDHVRHYRDFGYVVHDKNTVTLVDTPFTVVSHFDRGNMKVYYKVAFCSPKEKQFVKKIGIQRAQESNFLYEVDLDLDQGDAVSYRDIEDVILNDLVNDQGKKPIPNAHRKAFEYVVQSVRLFDEG